MQRVPEPALYQGPELELAEDAPRDAVRALVRAAEAFPQESLVTVGHDGQATRLPYPELLDRARRLLTGLRRHGLRPGDDLVLCGLPLREYFPAFWAALLGGARPAGIADRAEAGSPALERLRHTAELLNQPLVVCDAEGASALARTSPGLRVVSVEECLAREPAEDLVEPEESDVALLMLSSGSTGPPKAVRITHRGLADFAASARMALGMRPGHTTVNWLPVDHSGAFLLYHLLPVFTGCTNVHAPTGHVLAEPLRWLDLLDEHSAQHSWAPTFAYQLITEALAGHPSRRWDLAGVRSLVCGGEHLSLPVLRRFFEATAPFGLGESLLVPVWGMAETVTGITYGRLDRPGTVHRLLKDSLDGDLVTAGDHVPEHECVTFVASGAPAHGAALRVVDSEGAVLPERRIGRLQVCSAARITPGYVRNPEADAAAFPTGRDWLDTGDLAFLAEGQLVVTGRHKDMIIMGGHNVYCHEVEEVLAAVPGLRTGEVAACAVPDRRSGTETLAVFFAGRDPGEDERITREVKAALFRRLRLTASHVVPVPPGEFPKTPSGKVRRGVLLGRLESRPESELPPPVAKQPDAVVRMVREELAAELGTPVDVDVPFYELGLTSVQLVRIRSRLELRLGSDVPQVALFEHPTAASLARHLAGPEGAVGSLAAARRSAPAEAGDDRRVAVIGMAARFPGAESVEQFWTLLRDGESGLRVLTPEDLASAGLSTRQIREPDRVPVAGVLAGADAFDPDFFRMTPREAELTDPAHRLFLEVCHQALEDGGHEATGPGIRVGVFAGSGMNLYGHQHQRPGGPLPDDEPATGMQATIGREPDFLASRVAYRLGLTGPAIGVQTACSSSLVAVHLGVRALLDDDADMVLVGAAAVHTPQETGYLHHPGSILSPTGTCRAFAADADGTVGGNGVAAVLLKRLDRALADGDTVHAMIRGSAVNNDGAAKAGFSAPGVPGQTEVVRRALSNAGVPARSVSYVEGHGTGTPLGDPVEFEALARALGEGTGDTGFCALGSVKPAIGHLDSCAGMAGLIKTVLMLRHRTLVPTRNLDRPNPALALERGPLVLATELRHWRTPAGVPRRAGVSALGVGGTNAHVVLEEAPEPPDPQVSAHPVLVPVSANDADVLAERTARLSEHLRQHPGLSAVDVAATQALGRKHRGARTAVVARTTEELARALAQPVPRASAEPLESLTFAFPGQGSARRAEMRDIYAAFPEAQRVLDRCAEIFADEFGGALLPLLTEEDGSADDVPWPTETAQPALFAQQMALTELWRAFGIVPGLLLGHSVGEYAALCAGGAMSLEDGLRLTASRGRLMQRLCPPGNMLAVRCGTDEARRIARLAGAEVAACNGPRAQVVAGSGEALDEAARLLAEEGLQWRALLVDRAFHSADLDEAIDAFRPHAERMQFGPLHTPVVTGVDGRLQPAGWVPDIDYLCRQARQPVRFDLIMATAKAHKAADFLHMGAGAGLAGLGRHCLPDSRWLAGQGEHSDQIGGVLGTLAELYRRGAEPNWYAVVRSGGRVPLPGHPLRRRSFAPAPVRSADASAPADERQTPSVTKDRTPAPGSAGSDDVLRTLRELTGRKLGIELAAVHPDGSFFELGADSLSLMGLTTDIERRYGVRVPIRELFSGADTPRALADLVSARTAATAASPAPAADKAALPCEVAAAVTEPPGEAPARPDVPQNPRTAPAADAPAADAPAKAELYELFTRQLHLAEQLVENVSGVLSAQLDLLRGGGAATALPPVRGPATAAGPAVAGQPATPIPATAISASPPQQPAPPRHGATTQQSVPEWATTPSPNPGCDFSLYFFGDYPDDAERDKYGLILAAAEYADTQGFHALWFPERHFNSFGALFPNPSVLAAALAARTERIRLHAGSVVLPLHHPVRVAEEWSVVDNLSGGRVGLCFASGWHATDFALAPENFGRHREVMYEQMETVRALWAGDPHTVTGGDGRPAEIRLHPRPIQEQPPMYVAVVGNPDSYRRAAANDLGIVTNLMAQTVEQLAENIALYRRTRAEHGLDPAAGRVVVLVHTYLGEDAAQAREEAYRPFVSYLRSTLSLFNQVTNSLGFEIDLENSEDEDVEFLLGRAYERYCDSRALIGDEKSAAGIVRRLTAAGADEVACFVDFGVPAQRVLDALPVIDRLRRGTPGLPGAEELPAKEATKPPTAGTNSPSARAPLSPAQRRMWFLEQLHPGTSMYHEPKAVRLDGPLDVAALQWAVRQLPGRHPALRTVFRCDDGIPYRETLSSVRLDCPVTDSAGADEEQALRSALHTDGRQTFDLGDGPLISTRLLRLSDERHLLFLLAHHIVFDSSSTSVLIRDLATCYRARVAGRPAPEPPAHRGPTPVPAPGATAAALEFWQRELSGAPELTLPTDRPRPAVRSGAGAALTHDLDAGLVTALQRLAAGHRATLFMATAAAVAAVVGRFGGLEDVVLGTAVTARPPEAEDEVGLFLDTVALRLRLEGDPDFGELLRRVRETSTAAYEHRDVPFDELVAALNPHRDPGRNPLFQVLVEYEDEGRVDFAPPDVQAALLDVPSARAPFDLSFYLTRHPDGLRLMVEYDTELFEAGTVRRFVDYVEQVLRRAVNDPSSPLSALTAVTDADRTRLAELGGHGRAVSEAEDTLHGLFEEQASRCPDATALVTDDDTVSYQELDSRAEALSRLLRGQGAGRGERVAILLPRGAELIIAMLAVLKSGAAYLPLDPSAPGRRIAALLEDGAPAVVLTTEELWERLPAVGSFTVRFLDGTVRAGAGDELFPETGEDAPGPAVAPEDPAYLIHTSGSTGGPKGVLVPHRGPAALISAHLQAHPPLRTLQWTSPTFDVSVQEIFTTLAAGAALVLIKDEVRNDPHRVVDVVRREGVQRLFMPFTPLKYLMESEPCVPSLREIFSAGEPLRLGPAFQHFLASHPECVLHNQYGPTETSVIVTSHRVDPTAGDQPPIGTPVPGARIRLLDGEGREVPVGSVGEINVTGAPVALGYHRRPEETARAFLPDGAGGNMYRTGDLARWRGDGKLEYRGRVDEQVKVRGHRVEPGEVQAALNGVSGVLDAAVLPRRDWHGDVELVAYVVPADPSHDLEELRASLASELPGHLVPGRWVALERLPVSSSGKLDRSRLPDPATADSRRAAAPGTGTAPATASEKSLHELWAGELDLREVPVDRSFFELGGHSLSAVRLLNRMREELGVDLSMAEFFRRPTIRAVATDGEQPACGPTVIATAPATSLQRRLWHRHHERDRPEVYNVAHRTDIRGELDTRALERALDELVRRHDALRSRVVIREGQPWVEVLDEVPVRLPVEHLPSATDHGEAPVARFLQDAYRPFEMNRAPLFRFRLALVAPGHWVLLSVLHHAVCDGWSMGIVRREVELLYRDFRSGSETLPAAPAVQFTEVAHTEHGLPERRRAELEGFWRGELEGASLRPRLPADLPRPALLSGRGGLHRFVIDGELPRLVAECATASGSTPYSVLAAAFSVWLARTCDGDGDVVLAASSTNRMRPEHAEVVGMIGDAVLLRARLGDAVTFADLVTQLGTTLFTVLERQELPLTEVVRLVAPDVAEGLFPTVLFTVVTTPPPQLRLDGATTTVEDLPTRGTARNELYVVLVPREEAIEVAFEYSADLFTPATVAAWGERFAATLAEVVRDPATKLPKLTS